MTPDELNLLERAFSMRDQFHTALTESRAEVERLREALATCLPGLSHGANRSAYGACADGYCYYCDARRALRAPEPVKP